MYPGFPLMNRGAVILWDIQGARIPHGRNAIAIVQLMEQALERLGYSLPSYPTQSIAAVSASAPGRFDGTTSLLQSDPRVFVHNCYHPGPVEADQIYYGFGSLMRTWLYPRDPQIGLAVLVSGDSRLNVHLRTLQLAGYQVCIWYPEASRGSMARLATRYSDTWESIVQAPVQATVQAPVQATVQAPVQVQAEEVYWEPKCRIS